MKSLINAFENSNLSNFCEELSVPFNVARLNKARIVWVNERWFEHFRIDTSSTNSKEIIENSLIDEFGYMTPSIGGDNCNHGIAVKTVFADRYGETGGALHGGSGRCAYFGSFNAKGIGKTPLVNNMVDFEHSNGLLSMRDAIIEVIASESLELELKNSIIPIIAIIDTGFKAKVKSWNVMGEQCAIVVRPNFVRPAHFLRSIYFGTAGHEESSQFQDAVRVKEMILLHQNFSFLDFCTSMSKNIGGTTALRYWPGRMTASNITTDGKYLDFGTFRAVPSWNNFVGGPGKSFGNEIDELLTMISSMTFYFNKYDPNFCLNSINNLKAECWKNFRVGFDSIVKKAYFIDGEINSNLSNEVTDLYWSLYKLQQTRSVSAYGESRNLNASSMSVCERANTKEENIILEQLVNIDKFFFGKGYKYKKSIRRFKDTSNILQNEQLLEACSKICRRYEQTSNRKIVSDFITATISGAVKRVL